MAYSPTAAVAQAMPEGIGTVIELWTDATAVSGDASPDLRLYVSGDTVFHEDLAALLAAGCMGRSTSEGEGDESGTTSLEISVTPGGEVTR